MAETRLHNPDLKCQVAGTGQITIIGGSADLITEGFLDNENLSNLTFQKLMGRVANRLHITWESGAQFWDVNAPNTAAVFMSNIWQRVE